MTETEALKKISDLEGKLDTRSKLLEAAGRLIGERERKNKALEYQLEQTNRFIDADSDIIGQLVERGQELTKQLASFTELVNAYIAIGSVEACQFYREQHKEKGEQERRIIELEDRIEMLDLAHQAVAGIRYSELERRATRMREHPEEGVPHEEAMTSLREHRPPRNFKELREMVVNSGLKCVHCNSYGPTHNDCSVYGDNEFDGDEKNVNQRPKTSKAEPETPNGKQV